MTIPKYLQSEELENAHPKPAPKLQEQTLDSLSFLRSKIYGNELTAYQIEEIISDITLGYYSDIQISAFVTACAGNRLSKTEILNLTKAMVQVGNKIEWSEAVIVDKHCVGGLPGNRTTPIIVAIVTAFGLTMPKTSSRSITSPAGTADTMEVLAPVEFDVAEIKKIVAQEKGCIAWGGLAHLSPTDDILIRVERVLNLDSEGQMVASILSKKIAAGSNHILIEIPVGKTAKVRSFDAANILKNLLEETGENLGVTVKTIFTDGSQPVGNGIGPALEARDLVAVLKNDKNAPQDLREHALILAGEILEFSSEVKKSDGKKLATEILDSGQAWKKFQAICAAQGGLKEIPQTKFIYQYLASKDGVVSAIDNRQIALVAKLAGAPSDQTAGVDLFVKIGNKFKKNEALFAIHSDSEEALHSALSYFNDNLDTIQIA